MLLHSSPNAQDGTPTAQIKPTNGIRQLSHACPAMLPSCTISAPAIR